MHIAYVQILRDTILRIAQIEDFRDITFENPLSITSHSRPVVANFAD